MKALTTLFFYIIPFLVYAQNESRTVIQRDNATLYYNALEIDNDEVILFPGCHNDWCNEFMLDRIDQYGNLMETFTFEFPREGDMYFVKSTLPFSNNTIHCIISNNRADSIFLLNMQLNLETKETTLLDEFLLSTTPIGIILSPPKFKEEGYILAGTVTDGINPVDYIFITIQENGQFDDIQLIPQDESTFPILGGIRSLDIIAPNRYLITGRRLEASVIDSHYNQIYSIPFFEWDAATQDFIFTGNPLVGVILNDSTLLIDGIGAIGQETLGSQDQIIVRYKYNSDTAFYNNVVKVENLAGAAIYENQYGSMKRDINGDLILGGYENLSINPNGSGNPNHVYLAKYDTNLEKVWYKRFGGDFYHQSYNLTPLSNGNILIYGNIHNYFGAFEREGFYILVDGKGDIVSSTHSVFPIKTITVSPNPVKDRLHIDLPVNDVTTIQIYNSLGALVYQGQSENNIKVQEFPRGHYFLKIQGNGVIYQATFQKL